MKRFLLLFLVLLLGLGGCASGPHGQAQASNHGASASADIFRLPLP